VLDLTLQCCMWIWWLVWSILAVSFPGSSFKYNDVYNNEAALKGFWAMCWLSVAFYSPFIIAIIINPKQFIQRWKQETPFRNCWVTCQKCLNAVIPNPHQDEEFKPTPSPATYVDIPPKAYNIENNKPVTMPSCPPPPATATQISSTFSNARSPAFSPIASRSSSSTTTASNDQLLSWVVTHQPSMKAAQGRPDPALAQYQVDFERLNFIRPIGSGSFGRVYLAMWQETPVAVKILLDRGRDFATMTAAQVMTIASPVLKELNREAGLMASLRHSNIVQFMGVCTTPPAIITEYCSAGSLRDVLSAAMTTPGVANQLLWSCRINMAIDAAQGMAYLHNHTPQVVHRDLKANNLLVEDSWKVKIADFNLSKLLYVPPKTIFFL